MAFGDGGNDEIHWGILIFVFASCCWFISSLLNEFILKDDELVSMGIGFVTTSVLFYVFRNFVEFTDPRDKKLGK